MIQNKVEVKDLKELAGRYQYAWIQLISQVILKKAADLDEIDLAELLEARLFSNDKELHVFYHNDKLKAIETITGKDDVRLGMDSKCDSFQSDGDHYFEERKMLRSGDNDSLTLRHFIGHDEDGLAFIKQTVLCGLDQGGAA